MEENQPPQKPPSPPPASPSSPGESASASASASEALQPLTNLTLSTKRNITPSAPFPEPKRTVTATASASGSPQDDKFPATAHDTYTTEDGKMTSIMEQIAAGIEHVMLPKGFDIRNDPRTVAGKDPRYNMIADIFAGRNPVFLQKPQHDYLHVIIDKMPDFTLPLTIGGVPLVITSLHRDDPEGRPGIWPPMFVGSYEHGDQVDGDARQGVSDAELKKVAAKVVAHWKKLNVDVRHVLFTRRRDFIVVFRRGTKWPPIWDFLPHYTAQCTTHYVMEELFPAIPPHDDNDLDAKRVKLPDATPGKKIVNRTVYNPMRPGVLLSTNRPRTPGGTDRNVEFTSGVKVRHPDGTVLITAPTHCVEDSPGVCMPGQKGKPSVADPKFPHPDLDVFMVQLKENVRYYNTTFSTVFPAYDGIKLLKLRGEHDDAMPGYKVSLDSPFIGRVGGTVEAQHVVIREHPGLNAEVLDKHGIGQDVDMTVYLWSWHGQVRRLPKGTYGTPLVAEDGTVLGFYHLYIKKDLEQVVDDGYDDGNVEKMSWKGFGISVSASELSRKGYELVVETELSDD